MLRQSCVYGWLKYHFGKLRFQELNILLLLWVTTRPLFFIQSKCVTYNASTFIAYSNVKHRWTYDYYFFFLFSASCFWRRWISLRCFLTCGLLGPYCAAALFSLVLSALILRGIMLADSRSSQRHRSSVGCCQIKWKVVGVAFVHDFHAETSSV